jgi:hypothetical protein
MDYEANVVPLSIDRLEAWYGYEHLVFPTWTAWYQLTESEITGWDDLFDEETINDIFW